MQNNKGNVGPVFLGKVKSYTHIGDTVSITSPKEDLKIGELGPIFLNGPPLEFTHIGNNIRIVKK